jgi:nucleotide-binding universal stress UspA family protein
MYKTILFPVDGSVPAGKAMEYVEDMAVKYGSEVILLHTWYIPERFNGKPSNHYLYLAKAEEHMQEHGNKLLADTMEKMKLKGIKVKPLLVKGPVGPTIVSEAQANNSDLIVMGSRGLGNIQSFLISSASNYTLHHAKCPVLLVH